MSFEKVKICICKKSCQHPRRQVWELKATGWEKCPDGRWRRRSISDGPLMTFEEEQDVPKSEMPKVEDPKPFKIGPPFSKMVRDMMKKANHSGYFWSRPEVLNLYPEYVMILRHIHAQMGFDPVPLKTLQAKFVKFKGMIKAALAELIKVKLIVKVKGGYEINPAKILGGKIQKLKDNPPSKMPRLRESIEGGFRPWMFGNHWGDQTRDRDALLRKLKENMLETINEKQKRNGLPMLTLEDIQRYETAMAKTPLGKVFMGLGQMKKPIYQKEPKWEDDAFRPVPEGARLGPFDEEP